MLAEREPDNLPPPDEAEITNAYRELLEGYVMGDIATISSGSNVIDLSDMPFASDVTIKARQAEKALLGESNPQKAIEAAFRSTLRSYVYSDLQLDATLVILCAQLLGKDRAWLKEAIQPTHGVEYELRRFHSIDYDVSRMRHKHALRELKKAMHTMSMPSRLGAMALKLRNK